MEYVFTSNAYNINNLGEYDIALFSKNGNTYFYNVFDIGYNGNGSYYINEKNAIESAVFNYINSDTSVNEGLIYGYVYWPYDSNPYLCLNRQESSYFAFASLSDTNYDIVGYRITNGSTNGYLGQRKGLLNNFVPAHYNFVPTIEYDYINLTSVNGLIFDYDLANDNSYHEVTSGGFTTAYNSAFEISGSSYQNLYFKFGEREGNNQAYYQNGYNNGYQEGKASGYQEGKIDGYANGYTKGLTEGGNAPVGFLSMIGGAVNQFTPVLNIEVLPNVTLGTCISIPIICTMLVIIFRIARG